MLASWFVNSYLCLYGYVNISFSDTNIFVCSTCVYRDKDVDAHYCVVIINCFIRVIDRCLSNVRVNALKGQP